MQIAIGRSSQGFCELVVGAILAFTLPLAGHAQDDVKLISAPAGYVEPTDALARLARGDGGGSAILAAFRKDHQPNDSTLIKGNYDRYTNAQRRELVDGVVQIASTLRENGDKLTAQNIRVECLTILGILARDPEFSEAYELPHRLLQIYERTGMDEMKRSIVDVLGEVLRNSPAASPQIVELLVSLVNQPVIMRQRGYHGMVPVVEGPVHPVDALDALLSACEAGVPVLRRLQANRAAIQHDGVRARIDSLALEGFAPERMRLSWNGMNPCSASQGR